jgi:hypothetical protein
LTKEIHLLLDAAGALIVFKEKAREFCRQSHLDAAEVGAISTDDREAVAALVNSIKRRAIRNLLLDLDYKTGTCTQIDFDGDSFGAETARQLTPSSKH